MEVTVISKTVQKFNGESYYICGNYYQRKGKRLHRAVWEYHNGTIPTGYHIHHKDGNRSNNSIENLELIHGKDHLRGHMSTEERKEQSRRSIQAAVAKAPAWHRSEEGKQWHSEHSKESWQGRKMQTYECTYCGKQYQTKYVYPKGSNHFCHPNCKAAYRRKRLRDENQEH